MPIIRKIDFCVGRALLDHGVTFRQFKRDERETPGFVGIEERIEVNVTCRVGANVPTGRLSESASAGRNRPYSLRLPEIVNKPRLQVPKFNDQRDGKTWPVRRGQIMSQVSAWLGVTSCRFGAFVPSQSARKEIL